MGSIHGRFFPKERNRSPTALEKPLLGKRLLKKKTPAIQGYLSLQNVRPYLFRCYGYSYSHLQQHVRFDRTCLTRGHEAPSAEWYSPFALPDFNDRIRTPEGSPYTDHGFNPCEQMGPLCIPHPLHQTPLHQGPRFLNHRSLRMASPSALCLVPPRPPSAPAFGL